MRLCWLLLISLFRRARFLRMSIYAPVCVRACVYIFGLISVDQYPVTLFEGCGTLPRQKNGKKKSKKKNKQQTMHNCFMWFWLSNRRRLQIYPHCFLWLLSRILLLHFLNALARSLAQVISLILLVLLHVNFNRNSLLSCSNGKVK